MCRVIIFMVLIMATLGSAIPRAGAGVDLGISIGEEGLRSLIFPWEIITVCHKER